MITIVDTGVGNLASIKNMLHRAGEPAVITAEKQVIADARKLILPGIGAFDAGVARLESLDVIEVVCRKASVDKVPLLGICLGAQMLFEKSEEGSLPGLGLIAGGVMRFNRQRLAADQRIPHMGWSEVTPRKPSALFDGMPDQPRFYFVHSYHFAPAEPADELCTCSYGYPFAAAVERGNVYGVQFHPEKSHKYGLKLLENFARIAA